MGRKIRRRMRSPKTLPNPSPVWLRTNQTVPSKSRRLTNQTWRKSQFQSSHHQAQLTPAIFSSIPRLTSGWSFRSQKRKRRRKRKSLKNNEHIFSVKVAKQKTFSVAYIISNCPATLTPLLSLYPSVHYLLCHDLNTLYYTLGYECNFLKF